MQDLGLLAAQTVFMPWDTEKRPRCRNIWEKMGLNAFEYQCGRGVRISREAARELGDLSREKGIVLSLHAPYFISLPAGRREAGQKH